MRRPYIIKHLLVLIAGMALALPLAAGDFMADAMRPSPLKNTPDHEQAQALQRTFHDIYAQYRDSVVFITTEKTVAPRYEHPFSEDPSFRRWFFGGGDGSRERKQKGLGTGFIISGDGYICTNHHVVDKMDIVTVVVDEKEYRASIVGSDPVTDIALLKIEGPHALKPVYLGDSDTVQIGDMVIAIGNPFGLDRTLTSGIVSATGRNTVDRAGISHIQTDASINPGNSGGPLINLDGEVIGVNRMIFSRTGGSLGIGFAIPINRVRETLVELREHGKVIRGYLGVQFLHLSNEIARQLGLKKTEGALISGVERGGPADQGGIRAKDVVLSVDDVPVKDYFDLQRKINGMKIGSVIRIRVWRDAAETTVEVTVREQP